MQIMGLLTDKNRNIDNIGWLDVLDCPASVKIMNGSWTVLDDMEGEQGLTYRERIAMTASRIVKECFPEDRLIDLLKEVLHILSHMDEYDWDICSSTTKNSSNFTVYRGRVAMGDQLIDEINERIIAGGLCDPDLIWEVRVSNVVFFMVYPGDFCMDVELQQYARLPRNRQHINVVADAIVAMCSERDNPFVESLKNKANFKDL